MINNSHYLKVLLDKTGTIVEFENKLECCKTDDSKFIGENWFETFIETEYISEIMDVFIDLIMGDRKKWKSFQNKIIINDKLISLDFDNEVIIKDGQYFVYSVGVEHH